MSIKKNNIIDPKLLELRTQIDNIDSKIIDLLINRMQIVDKVALFKKSQDDLLYIKSNREADMIKDISNRLKDYYPKSHIISIWRKIIAASNLREQDIKIGLYNPNNITDYQYIINEYYSQEFIVKNYDDAQLMIKEIKDKNINIALISCNLDNNDWWQYLAKSNIKIFAKIPFQSNSDHKLYCLAIKNVEPSKNDVTILSTKYNNDIDLCQIQKKISDLGYKLSIIAHNIQNKSLLIEILGYLDDKDLVKINDQISAKIIGYCAVDF